MRSAALSGLVLSAWLPACFADEPPDFGAGTTDTSGAASLDTTSSTSTTTTTSTSTTTTTTGEPTTTEPAASTSTGDTTTTDPATSTTSTTTGEPPPSCGEPLYESTFEVDPELQVLVGNWFSDPGIYGAMASDSASMSWLGPQPWLDVRIATRVRLAGDGGLGGVLLQARMTGSDFTAIFIGLAPAMSSVVVGTILNDTGQGQLMADVGDIAADAWHDLQVDLVGDVVDITLDGVELSGLQIDPGGGSVGLIAQGTQVEFDALTVCAL